jgi:hypothetical protein
MCGGGCGGLAGRGGGGFEAGDGSRQTYSDGK